MSTTDTFPRSYVLDGVLMQMMNMNMSWASCMAWVIFVEQKRLLSWHALTRSSNPGWKHHICCCINTYTTGHKNDTAIQFITLLKSITALSGKS